MRGFYRIIALLMIGFLCVLPEQGNAKALLEKVINVLGSTNEMLGIVTIKP